MARTAAAGFWSRVRGLVRTAGVWPSTCAALLLLFGLTLATPCRAEPVKGEATFSAADGYARLVFKLATDVSSRSDDSGVHSRHPLQPPGRHCRRKTGRGRARLCLLGAPRSRRHRDPALAGAQGHGLDHGGRRAGVRRHAARWLERSAAEPAARRGPRTRRTRARRRARASPAARRSRGQEAAADPRARPGAADLRAFRVRDARRRRRLLGAERPEADPAVQRGAQSSTSPTPRSRRRRTSPRSARRSRQPRPWSRSR